MVGVPNWVALEQRVDDLVDITFAEPVELHPWTDEGYSGDGGPDTSRKPVFTNGAYVTSGSKVVGEAASGSAIGAAILEMEVWLSIQATLLGPITYWKAQDRVYWPDRNEWYSINYIPPSATYRYNVHLTRLNDAALQAAVARALRPKKEQEKTK